MKPCKYLFYSMQNKPHCMVELKEQKISIAIDTKKCKNSTKYEPSNQFKYEVYLYKGVLHIRCATTHSQTIVSCRSSI